MLIDRGRRYETIFLKGNHEVMLFDLLGGPEIFPTFKQYGGIQTLLSYGLAPSINPDREEQLALVEALVKRFQIVITFFLAV